MDQLLSVPHGVASVIDVHAAIDPTILEKIVESSAPAQDQIVNRSPHKKQKTKGKGEKGKRENEVGLYYLLFDFHYISFHYRS